MNPIVKCTNIFKELYKDLCVGKPKGVIVLKFGIVPKGIDVINLGACVEVQLAFTTILKICCPLVVNASSSAHD
jgi:hypothetical protein